MKLDTETIDTIRKALLAYLIENGVEIDKVAYRTISTKDPQYMIIITPRGMMVSTKEDGVVYPNLVSFRIHDPESFPKVLEHIRSEA